MSDAGPIFFLLVALFLIVLFILWVLLPFLIMGTNRRLDRAIALLNEGVTLLNESNGVQEKMAADLAKLAREAERTLGR